MPFQLVYGSTANYDMLQDELITLLDKSRQNNEQRNVTGMLLYHDRSFLQVLEGEEDAVKDLYRIIAADSRHHSTSIIYTKNIQQRHFPDWEMGFTNLEDIDPSDIPGFTDFLDTSLQVERLREQPSRADVFLNVFRNGVR